MKMKVFVGAWYEAQDAFNKWAKGKNLSRDVIIHTAAEVYYEGGTYAPNLAIIVIHPEDPFWDKTEAEPIPAVQPEVSGEPRVESEEVTVEEQPTHKTDEEISRLEREATG